MFANAKAAVARLISEMNADNASEALAEIEARVHNCGPDTAQAAADLARARHDELLAHPAHP
ncbi:MAG: hypothetical protein HYU66_21265 [Armatimonadetes bacterium]|nr:hypothetical protein [Armatimonadota bacterium]